MGEYNKEFLKFVEEYKKPKNWMMLIIAGGSISLLIFKIVFGTYGDYISIPDTFLFFVLLLSLSVVALSMDQDEKHAKITSCIKNQDVGHDDKHKEIITLIDDQKDYIPFANTVVDSQFEFKKMVCDATRSIFIIGPTLTFLSENEQGMKELLFQKLKTNQQSFKIRMLLADPGHKEICDVMSEYSYTETFPDELCGSIKTFLGWKKEADEHNPPLNNLMIKKTHIITFSLLFIDAEDHNARVLVTPIPWRTSGGSRPCFLIKKKQHKEAFKTYYVPCDNLFNKNSEDIKPEDIEKACRDVS